MKWMHTVTDHSSSSRTTRASIARDHPALPAHSDSSHIPLQKPPHLRDHSADYLFLEEASSVAKDTQRKHRPSPLRLDTEHESLEYQATGFSPSSSSDESQMGRKSGKPRRHEPDQATSKATGGQNGHTSGSMELRRKHPSLESPTAASQTARLMDRDDFSLDEKPPLTPATPGTDTSFFDLPRQDRRNFLLLVLLYFLQGIPMGLASGSVPFLLKSHLSYGQIGVFTLASYPYSLKLLWSPIVDAVWSPTLGRRKSWILPIQTFSGLGMIYLGSRIKDMMVSAGANDGSGVWAFTGWWFFLVFLCATQDIAVDGMHTLRNVVAILLTCVQAGRLL